MEKTADIILKQKRFGTISRWSLFWALVNAILAGVLIYDITAKDSSLSKLFVYQSLISFTWYSEIGLAILFSWNSVFDICVFLWPTISSHSIVLAPIQKRLFGIKDNDPGFVISTPKKASTPASDTKSQRPKLLSSFLQFTPYQSTPNKQFMNSYSHMAQYSPSMTQMNYSASSWLGNSTGMSMSMSTSPNLTSSCSSWNYFEDYPNSLNSSLNQNSFNSFSMDEGNTSLRKRFSQNTPNKSFSSLSEFKITDEKDLENYMDEYNKLEQKWNQSNKENCQNVVYNSLSNVMNTTSQFLKKYQYQPACKSPQSSTTLAGDRDSPTTFESDVIFRNWKISEDKMSQTMENLRKWLNQTILVNLVAEIDTINETLSRQGSPDLQIGVVNLSSLRQISITKASICPTLPTLIPYLEVTIHQGYLVRRLRELSKGGCISEFRWNGGGSFDEKQPWNEEYPTDSALLMHIFCTYLDSRLPPHPNFPDGKTFSSQHFKKTPDKAVTSNESLYIYQSKINPPHYKLVIGEEIWDVPKGRNNTFYTIILFLHFVKVNFDGMLGRINLGASGVNILCTVDELKE